MLRKRVLLDEIKKLKVKCPHVDSKLKITREEHGTPFNKWFTYQTRLTCKDCGFNAMKQGSKKTLKSFFKTKI